MDINGQLCEVCVCLSSLKDKAEYLQCVFSKLDKLTADTGVGSVDRLWSMYSVAFSGKFMPKVRDAEYSYLLALWERKGMTKIGMVIFIKWDLKIDPCRVYVLRPLYFFKCFVYLSERISEKDIQMFIFRICVF